MKNIKKQAIVITSTFILALLLMSAVSANDNPCEEQLCVEFNDDPQTEICVNKRDSPSPVLHFDVEGPPANATNATLTLKDCTTVDWGKQGREKSDLSDCPQGYKGYWHFVYTPAGILALSSSNCVKAEGTPTILVGDDVRVCPKTDIPLRARLTDEEGTPLEGKTINFCWVTNVDINNPQSVCASAITDADGWAEYIIVGGLPKCPFSGPDECRYNVLAWFAGDDIYQFSQTDFNILVRQFDTEIAVLNVAGNQGDEVILSAALTKKDDNSPIEGKTVNFKVNGVFVGSALTNAQGIATQAYTITQTKGKYNITAEFEGEGCFRGAEGKGELDVKFNGVLLTLEDVTICPLGKPIATARLTDLEGNPLPGRTIKFSINPETEGVTNAKGIAIGIFNPLPLGTYIINALFEGDADYASAAASSTLNVTPEKYPTKLTLDNVKGSKGDQVKLRATLTDEKGIPLEGQTINFYVNGVFVGSSLTNAAGVATVLYTITQNAGTYTISAVFEGFECHLASTAEASLHVLSSAYAGTVPMQETGTHLAPLVAGIMAVLAGLVWKKK